LGKPAQIFVEKEGLQVISNKAPELSCAPVYIKGVLKHYVMAIKVLFLNCTLKKSPLVSNTRALVDKAEAIFTELGVESEIIRVVDYNVAFGISSDEGGRDEWPLILEKIKSCDILIIASPIWFGVRSAVTQMVIERLDGTYMEGDPQTGQYPLYGKVAGVIVTGNEDGAHNVAATTLYNLTHLGCIVPPNVDCYWVGDAGPGPSYIEAGGDRHLYTNRTVRYMVHNLVYFAKLLKENPIPTNLKKLDEEAKKVSN
jgi:multimeric flavodoxin WrbA